MITNRPKNIEQKIIYLIIILIVAFFFLPFVLFGKDSIVAVNDNLDSTVAWYKMYHDNGLFFKFDILTKGFSEMSTLYYSQVGYYFQSMLYMLFSDFIAYVVSYYFSICLGFISMYILLKKTFCFSSNLSILVSACYAILPVLSIWNIAVSTMPLIIAAFYHFAFKDTSVFSWKVLFLLFFPFFSFFATFGFFIMGFWFIGFVVLGIKNKRINLNLLVGFLLLCIGYILVDLQLFYVMFILKTPLNRITINYHPNNFSSQMEIFMSDIRDIGVRGMYQVASFQRGVIRPFAFFVFLIGSFMLICRIKNSPGTLFARIKTDLVETIIVKRLFLLGITIFVLSCFGALYNSGLLRNFIAEQIPFLHGFNWGRVFYLNRVLWYIIFAFCLQFIMEIKSVVLEIKIGNLTEKIKLSHFFFRLSAGIIVCLQFLYIAIYPLSPVFSNTYRDQTLTWFNELVIKTGIAKKLMPSKNLNNYLFISYREFFSEDFFKRIKDDISYSDERVVALGYHPGVLMYNGFSCIDGFNNAYPLSYMQKFRSLIAPEFEVNQSARVYFDGFPVQMYLYNSELDWRPTRDKDTSPVKLNIDMDVFRNDFNGVYILSRAEISNATELGLDLVKRYYDEESIYTIFLYRAD